MSQPSGAYPRKAAGLTETPTGRECLVMDAAGRELMVLNRTAMLVFSLCNGVHSPEAIAAVLKEIHPDAPAAQVAEDVRDCLAAFAGFSEPFVQVLHATPESAILRHDVFDRAPLSHWGEGRVTMLGDASHPMTPNLGQGACMAIEDAVVLASCLREQPNLLQALRNYEAARMERTKLMTTRSFYVGKILTLEDGVLSWFRDRLLHSKLGESQAESVLEKLLSYQVPTL